MFYEHIYISYNLLLSMGGAPFLRNNLNIFSARKSHFVILVLQYINFFNIIKKFYAYYSIFIPIIVYLMVNLDYWRYLKVLLLMLGELLI